MRTLDLVEKERARRMENIMFSKKRVTKRGTKRVTKRVIKSRTLPRPGSTRAKLNRAKRVALMKNNKKRSLLKRNRDRKLEELRNKRMDKEFVRNEKNKIKEAMKQERLKLALEKKRLMELRKVDKVVIECSPAKAEDLSRSIGRLVPTPTEIMTMTHSEYTNLRSEMSKQLTRVRLYSEKCNFNYSRKKKSQDKRRRNSPGVIYMPQRDTFIPDIGMNVPIDIPVSEAAFERARKKLRMGKQRSQGQIPLPTRKKKRIAPMLVM